MKPKLQKKLFERTKNHTEEKINIKRLHWNNGGGWRKTIYGRRIPTDKCRRNDEIRKLSLGSHYSKDCFRQELMNTETCKQKYYEEQILVSKYFPLRYFLITKIVMLDWEISEIRKYFYINDGKIQW